MTSVLGLVAFGCSDGGSDVLTYEEFKAQAYQEPDTGIFVFGGDDLAENEDQLRAVYESYLGSARRSRGDGFSTTEQSLTVNLVNGQHDRWAPQDAVNLRYCVDQASFGGNYATAVNAMAAAAAAWEAIAGVDFIHVAALDGACNAATAGVTFDVRQVCPTPAQFGARAFFPSYARENRNILVDCSQFGNIAPLTLTGVLRHELGHALGFRHEHVRLQNNPDCQELQGPPWEALTAYDPASVMHYRLPYQCGSEQSDYTISALDQQGAALLYPQQAAPSATFHINGQPNGNLALYANTPFTLSYTSTNAVSCDLTAYWNGSLWYSVPNFITSYNWGTVTGFGAGSYSWHVACRNAAGQTAFASASLTMVTPPCVPYAGAHGQLWMGDSAYSQYAYHNEWCSVGTIWPAMCWGGTYYYSQYLLGASCASVGSNDSCYDPDAWWWVTCNSLVDCIYSCSGECVKADC